VTRAACQALLKANGRVDLWRDVTDRVPARPYQAPRGRPFEPEGLAGLVLADPYARQAWELAITGMEPAVYFAHAFEVTDRVAIHGTKLVWRDRVVPLVGPVRGPETTYRAMLDAFKAASGRTLYDLRRTYAVWLEDAGIPATRVALYMGHKPQDVTQLYTWRVVEPYLAGDAVRVAEYLAYRYRRAV
jgi:hypothetical protein